MTEETSNNKDPKEIARCSECDRENTHYFSFILPSNEVKIVCWECQDREDKGFNMKRTWKRSSRQHSIEEVAAANEEK